MCKICDNSYSNQELEELVYLDCSECKTVTSLPASLPSLKFLSMYNTSIASIPSYPLLEALYCFNSPIKTIPALPKVRKIIAHDTKLEMIRDDYHRLEILNIDNTSVADIPESMVSLTWLSANRTNLSSISCKLISLEWLSIEKTNVTHMPTGLMSLQYLNCSDTGIRQIDTKKYKTLRKLIARNCGIDPFSFTTGLDVIV